MNILETNLTRMFEEGFELGFILISACRGSEDLMNKPRNELSDKEKDLFKRLNNERTNNLKKNIKSQHLTFNEVDGGYIEKTGETVIESSFFIYNYDYTIDEPLYWQDFLNLGKLWCKKYNQDSFLWFDPQTQSIHKGKIAPCYLDRDGRMVSNSFYGKIYNDMEQEYFTWYKNNRVTLQY